MELRRIKTTREDAWEDMYALYMEAFPYCERCCEEAFSEAMPLLLCAQALHSVY